ncbi:hypothetical protein ABZP36_009712 [Zizania latifolia]
MDGELELMELEQRIREERRQEEKGASSRLQVDCWNDHTLGCIFVLDDIMSKGYHSSIALMRMANPELFFWEKTPPPPPPSPPVFIDLPPKPSDGTEQPSLLHNQLHLTTDDALFSDNYSVSDYHP